MRFQTYLWFAMAFWGLLSLWGCYEPKVFVPKAENPKVKIYVSIEPFDATSLEGQMQGFQNEELHQALRDLAQLKQQMSIFNQNLEQRLKNDLIRYRLAFPTSSEEDADLKLIGKIHVDLMNRTILDWQLIDRHRDVMIYGHTLNAGFVPNDAEMTDAIIEELMTLELNDYGQGNTYLIAPAPAKNDLDQPIVTKMNGSKDWAVVIGIERYRDDLPKALHAAADARAFANYAHQTLGIPSNHIKMLINDRATLADLKSAFEEWLPRNAIQRGSRVYVYYSGHGAPDVQTGEAYLVPYDADPAYLKSRGYALKHLYAQLENQSKRHGIQPIVFLDACFSGSGGKSVLPKGSRPLVPVKDLKLSPKLIVFAASKANQVTGAAPNAPHGLFTYYLLRAMRGEADLNKDQQLSIRELAQYVQRHVQEEARLENREQEPTLISPSTMMNLIFVRYAP